MYRLLTFFVLVFIGLASATFRNLKPLDKELDLCHYCVDEAAQVINVIANLILDKGVFDSCGALCDAVANKTGSQSIGETCDIVCDTFGFAEFIKLIEKSDIDPLYYCEVLRLCPSKVKQLF